jgi:uncharacterized membrane protein
MAGAAALRARGGEDLRSLGLLAVGTATKFYPAAFAPILVLRRLLRGDRRGAVVGSIVFLATLVLIYLPAIVAARSTAKFVAAYAVSKPANFDSFWELPTVVLQAAGVDAALIVVGATALGLLITYAVGVLPRALRAADPVTGFALAVVTVLFWTRFYSPQYSIWLLPFFVLLSLRIRTFVLISIADVGVFVGISLLTLVLRPDDALAPVALVMLVASVVVRQLMLVVLWREVAGLGDRELRSRRDRRVDVASA